MADLEAATTARGLQVRVKMRLADVVDVERSGLSNQDYSYALRAHLDFVVSRDGRALFAAEFDGEQHDHDPSNQARDDAKDRICERLGLPLVRFDQEVPGRSLGATSIVDWLIEYFLRGEAIEAYQRAGGAPGEMLDPRFSVELVDGRVTFPLDPSMKLRVDLLSRYRKGQIASMAPTIIVWETGRRVHAVSDIEVKPGTFLCAHVSIRDFSFGPVPACELAEQMALAQVMRRLDGWLQGQTKPRSWQDLCLWLGQTGAPVIVRGEQLELDMKSGRLRYASGSARARA